MKLKKSPDALDTALRIAMTWMTENYHEHIWRKYLMCFHSAVPGLLCLEQTWTDSFIGCLTTNKHPYNPQLLNGHFLTVATWYDGMT